MKRILLLFTIIALVWSCEKDDKLSPIELLMREKDKVNQDSINSILEGKWYGKSENGSEIYLEFFYGFKKYQFDSEGYGPFWSFNTQEYFFIKNDQYPDVYKLYTLKNNGTEGEISSTFFKINKDGMYYLNAMAVGRIDQFPYESIMTGFDNFDQIENIGHIAKMQKIK